jgi:hypothetical protein
MCTGYDIADPNSGDDEGQQNGSPTHTPQKRPDRIVAPDEAFILDPIIRRLSIRKIKVVGLMLREVAVIDHEGGEGCGNATPQDDGDGKGVHGVPPEASCLVRDTERVQQALISAGRQGR